MKEERNLSERWEYAIFAESLKPIDGTMERCIDQDSDISPHNANSFIAHALIRELKMDVNKN